MVVGLNKAYSFIGNSVMDNAVSRFLDSHFRDLFIGALNTGPLPRHVAFIMDGNRRYAKSRGLKLQMGHQAGAMSLVQIMDSCMKMSIEHVSIYAFSIENFNRSEEEVRLLFELLMDRLTQIADVKGEYSDKARIRIIGNRSYIPPATLQKLEEIENDTKDNTNFTLNICFAYTSRDEITNAIQKTIAEVLVDDITVKQITETVLANNFYYGPDTPPVDLLIRTSGHTRLSDYLIWQVNESCDIVFLPQYWPEFTVFQFFSVLLKWSFNKSLFSKLNQYHSFVFSKAEDTKKSLRGSHRHVKVSDLPPAPPLVTVLGELTTRK